MKKIIFIILAIIPFMGVGQNPLFIPDTLAGSSINLNLHEGQVQFYPGSLTNTIGYNQDILGPTLILEKGNNVILNVTNSLSEPTTLHWHGLHVSAKNDGGPHTVIEAGQVWSPSFTVLDNAATYWYHPHLHEHTEEQVTRGAAGFIIVRDDEEDQLELPRTYGIDDFPIVIQSRAFDTDNQFTWNTASDDVLLCNGTLDAVLDVPAQVVRLRLLNGSTERVYNLGLQGNASFFQIGTDGGLLDKPIQLNRLQLAPAERAEILLDLTNLQGQSTALMSYGSELQNGIYGAPNPSGMQGGMMMGSIEGYSSNPLNGSDFIVLKLNVIGSTMNPITNVPSVLISNAPYLEDDADVTRSLFFRPSVMGPTGMLNGPFTINSASFDLAVINYEIPFGNVEVWELTNMTAISHPFHIHGVQFYILDINGSPPSANLQGKKDVVLVPPMFGTVRFITKFEDFIDEEIPYMYHCHMLSHEDDGMMGQFIVLGNTTRTEDSLEEEAVSIYPNPVSNTVALKRLKPSTIELYNASGLLLERRTSAIDDEQYDMRGYATGLYYFKIITAQQSHSYKVIKN